MVPAKKTKILLLFCGGTIAMAPDPKTGSLRPALKPEELYSMAPKIRQYADIDVKFITDIDSTNMTSKEWSKIIEAIHDNMESYDAFLLTHGTDTMAETANAIAFAFGCGLKKPVVITGSQAAPHLLGTDAIANLERAVSVAINTTRPEVMISFHDHVFRGTRTQKTSERKLNAFHSPAEHPLAEHMGDTIHWNVEKNPKKEKHESLFLPYFNERVVSISLHAASDAGNITESLLVKSVEQRPKGFVWTSLGAGNIPESLYPAIEATKKINIPIVVTSQFPGGKLNMNQYESGRKALEAGVIPAGNMTPESAIVKLKWALGLAEHEISSGKLAETQLIPFVRLVFEHERANEITLDESKPLPVSWKYAV
ncbi:MAG: asparaginase [Candidatus Diapherotrites archaeon]